MWKSHRKDTTHRLKQLFLCKGLTCPHNYYVKQGSWFSRRIVWFRFTISFSVLVLLLQLPSFRHSDPVSTYRALRETQSWVLPFQASTVPLLPSVNAYSCVLQDTLHMHHTSVESGVRQKPNQSHDSGVGPEQVDAPYKMTQEA